MKRIRVLPEEVLRNFIMARLGGVLGGKQLRLKAPKIRTPWRMGGLERDFPAPELFETLQSTRGDELAQCHGEAQERRPRTTHGVKAQGGILEGGEG
jgi:hypothetical protein